MKKSLLLVGLLTTTICLAACGSKNYEMTFEEALEIANHSELQDIISQNDNFEQDFSIAGNYDSDGISIDANITSNSKENLNNKNSESSTKIAANITAEGETLKVDGTLDLKIVSDTIYLNLSSLELTGSEDVAMMGMMVEGFKNQWFYIPLTGLSEIPSTFSIFKDSQELNNKSKEIILNEGSTTYNGKYSQFNGYNAWKFSIDNEKLNALIKEYYNSLNSLEEDDLSEIPEINIQNFEGYLVITGKDKVATVIENMEIQDNDTVLSINGFAGEDFELYLSEGGETIITITAKKESGKYLVSANFADAVLLNGTISAKLSKSSIDLTFDASLTVKAEVEGENDTVVPFNGSWKYKGISEFTTTIPENAQDLTELLGAYLGGMMGGDDYYDYDYDEDYDYEDYDYELEALDESNESEELENVEAVEEAVEETA